MSNPFSELIDIVTGRVDDRLKFFYDNFDLFRHQLTELAEQITAQLSENTRAHFSGVADTGATTTATVTLQATAGTAWILHSVALTSGTGGACNIYLNGADPTQLLAVVASATIYSDKQMEIYVPQGQALVFVFTGQPNNTPCIVSAQVEYLSE